MPILQMGKTESHRNKDLPETLAGTARDANAGKKVAVGSDSPGKQPQLTKRGNHANTIWGL